MTYGWAILIIAVVLAALFQLGVFNASSFSPRAPPGACQVFRPSGPGTVTNLNLMGVCTGQLPQYVAKFDGVGSYVDVGNSQIFKITSSPLTISAWVMPMTLTADNRVFADFVYMASGYAMNIYADGRFYLGTWQASAQQSTVSSSGAVKAGVWTHIAVTRNGASAKTYANGVDLTTTPASHIDPAPSTVNAWIGRGSGWPFNGFIANVQIYNTSLSANEVQALYLEGMGGAPIAPQYLLGWWPLNGNSNDYSGNNNNGAPAGVTFTSQYGK